MPYLCLQAVHVIHSVVIFSYYVHWLGYGFYKAKSFHLYSIFIFTQVFLIQFEIFTIASVFNSICGLTNEVLHTIAFLFLNTIHYYLFTCYLLTGQL
jgi:hypothetical protein